MWGQGKVSRVACCCGSTDRVLKREGDEEGGRERGGEWMDCDEWDEDGRKKVARRSIDLREVDERVWVNKSIKTFFEGDGQLIMRWVATC